MAFFHRVYKRKKVVRTIGTKRKPRRGAATELIDDIMEEVVIEHGQALTAEEEELAATMEDEEQVDDDGESAHNEQVVNTVRTRAVTMMMAGGVFISPQEEKDALCLVPKTSGLARKVHDSTTLGEKFAKLVNAEPSITSSTDKRSLDRRVPTRWNSDLACFDAHIVLRIAVEQLTAPAANKLNSFRLNEAQWLLLEQVVDVLSIFEDGTLLFSQSSVPLIHEAVPLLRSIQVSLAAVRDATDLPNVIRVAAQASLLVCNKYFSLSDDCEVYRIAIAMCPDKKLQWFRDQGWCEREITEVKEMVIRRWEESYKTPDATASAVSTSGPTIAASEGVTAAPTSARGARWRTLAAPAPARPADSIYTYLEDVVIPSAAIEASGGVMKFWFSLEGTCPNLSRMGSDFCSAPGMLHTASKPHCTKKIAASSVDAERSFSDGQRQVNFMQHNMTSQTFKAQMSVGSWDGTPIFPDISRAVSIIEQKTAG